MPLVSSSVSFGLQAKKTPNPNTPNTDPKPRFPSPDNLNTKMQSNNQGRDENGAKPVWFYVMQACSLVEGVSSENLGV